MPLFVQAPKSLISKNSGSSFLKALNRVVTSLLKSGDKFLEVMRSSIERIASDKPEKAYYLALFTWVVLMTVSLFAVLLIKTIS